MQKVHQSLKKRVNRSNSEKTLKDRCSRFAFILVSVVCLCAIVLVPKDYDDFLDALGRRESSDNYQAKNRFGYLGQYQLGEMALQDAGFKDENGIWTSLAETYGISCESDFLNCPAGQDAAVKAYHTKLCDYIRSYGLDQYIGSTYCGIKVTKSGLLAACHLVGVKSMKEALQTGNMVYDGNHIAASEYMELFAGFDISEVW